MTRRFSYALIMMLLGMVSNSCLVIAQSANDTLERFYSYNHSLKIEKIEREHIPLHGDSVDMIPFRVDEKYGFVDPKTGKWLIQPTYNEVFTVNAEGGVVKGKQGYGLVNRNGKVLIPLQFDNLVNENGVYRGSIFGIIDTTIKNEMFRSFILSMYFNRKGQFLFKESAHDFKPFEGKDTLTWFRYGQTYTIRSVTGRVVKQFKFDLTKRFLTICDNLLIFVFNRNNTFLYQVEDEFGQIKFSVYLNEHCDGIN